MDILSTRVDSPPMQPHLPRECEHCSLSGLCRASRQDEPLPLATSIRSRKLVHRGESVYRAGDRLQNLYVLRSGSMKIRVTSPSGLEQITDFPLAGALLGLDALESGIHVCDAIALEDSMLCILPFAELVGNCQHDLVAAQQLHRLIARDINQCRRLLLSLGCMTTDERVADFVMGISEQMASHGYSPREFTLKMTREDIASHLGMKVETVCRVLARLQEASLLNVSRRHVEIRNVDALRKISSG